MAKLLTMTLIETGQEIPNFLEQYKPEDTSKLKFEYDTDEEDPGEDGDAWGTGGDAGAAGTVNGDDGNGWGPTNGSGDAGVANGKGGNDANGWGPTDSGGDGNGWGASGGANTSW